MEAVGENPEFGSRYASDQLMIARVVCWVLHILELLHPLSSGSKTAWQRTLCAMLPFCDRVVSVPRNDVAPVWTRSFPIAKEPTTLGQHLRKKRFLTGTRQSEAAQKLGVSRRTLSVWETDRVYPAWAFQPRLITYLGYDPFNNPTLGRPKGNETSCVAILSPDAAVTLGQTLKQHRLKLRKTRKQTASELGVSVKTLWGWEKDRREPAAQSQKQIAKFLKRTD
jgi:DNA-binding XRE family transcriptional regulator